MSAFNKNRRRAVWIAIALGLTLAGCERTRSYVEPTIGRGDHEYVCAIAIDLSGSFRHHMAENGKAYDFLMAVLKQYFDSRAGTSDKIIIAQLSGTNRSLLWEGTPLELRQDFPTATAFRDFVIAHTDPAGSVLHDGIRNALDYVASDPRVASGQARSAFFVLSDMLDTTSNPAESERQLVQSFAAYGKQGHVVGLYYVDQLLVPTWRRNLQNAGVREYCVEGIFHGKPALPSFER